MKLPNFNKPKVHIRMIDQKNLQVHSLKLQNIEPNMTKIQTFVIQEKRQDLKKQQTNEDRFTQIEKDNRMLLEKIMNIMAQKGSNSNKEARPRSLNIGRRRQDQEHIIRENLFLLKRLGQRKSDYAKTSFDRQWKQSEKYQQNLEYPNNQVPLTAFGQIRTKRGADSFQIAQVAPQIMDKEQNKSFGS